MELPFKTHDDVIARIRDPQKLSLLEIRDALRFSTAIQVEVHKVPLRLQVDLAEHLVEAIQEFDRKSANLTGWLIGLTAALVLLTGALLFFTVKLAAMVK